MILPLSPAKRVSYAEKNVLLVPNHPPITATPRCLLILGQKCLLVALFAPFVLPVIPPVLCIDTSDSVFQLRGCTGKGTDDSYMRPGLFAIHYLNLHSKILKLKVSVHCKLLVNTIVTTGYVPSLRGHTISLMR